MRGNTVPEGFHTVTPYLLVKQVPPLLKFLKDAFAAEEVHVSSTEEGVVNHAQVLVGDSMVMMGKSQDGFPPMPTMLYLYVDDVDGAYARAVAAGGESLREPTDETYGDRSAGVRDMFGNQYWMATPIRNN